LILLKVPGTIHKDVLRFRNIALLQ